jgi:uncharacterized membrane protein
MLFSSWNGMPNTLTFTCPACGLEHPVSTMRSGRSLPELWVADVQKYHPHWTKDDPICENCVRLIEMDVLESQLRAEKGEPSTLDEEVLETLRRGSLLLTDLNQEPHSTSEKIADRVSVFIASWKFPLLIVALLLMWIVLNFVFRPFNPYPVILFAVISAVLATLAALQAPIILMSQQRQRQREQLKSENDYRVNLKAELEIRALNDKIDHLLEQQQELFKEFQSFRKSNTISALPHAETNERKQAHD